LIDFIKKDREYTTKLDSYYYDRKVCKTILILKIRNKRVISRLSVQEVLTDKAILRNLHPIDLCIIGVLANLSSDMLQDANNETPVPVSDDFLMTKVNPLLEIVGRNYAEEEELISLKLKPLNKTIIISASELYQNKKLINALKYQDAISLGFSVSIPHEFLQKNTMRPNNKKTSLCLMNGFFLMTLVVSVLLLGRVFPFDLFGSRFIIKGEILLMPVAFFLQYIIVKENGLNNAKQILLGIMLSLIAFILYFRFIVKLPYFFNDHITMAFHNLYHSVTSHPSNYLFCFLIATIANLYSSNLIINALKDLNPIRKNLLIGCIFGATFLVCFMCFQCLIENL
jgi:uncharacterized membrane protein (GlpM family)